MREVLVQAFARVPLPAVLQPCLVDTMMVAHTIDVAVADQGLQQIYESAQVQKPVSDYLSDLCGVATTTDLLGYFAVSTFEAEIKEVLAAKFPVVAATDEGPPEMKIETQRLYISRLRAAFKLAMETDRRIKAEAAKPAEAQDKDCLDLERPLDPASVEKLEKSWDELHPKLKFIGFMRPAPHFRNRLFREFHNKVASVTLMEKVKSLEDCRSTSEPERVDMGAKMADGSKLVFEQPRKTARPITDCLSYLTALRVFMNACAYCGSHTVASSADVGKTVVFFPFEVAIGYVDEVTQATLAMKARNESERLHWLRKRDEQVRGEMIALINDGFSGGEALTTSWKKLAHIWVIRDGAQASETQQDYARAPTQRYYDDKGKGAGKGRKGKQDDKGARDPGQDPLAGVKRKAMDPYTKKNYCGAYNSKKGCVWNQNRCPYGALHKCNVIKPNGDVCGSTTHGACQHR